MAVTSTASANALFGAAPDGGDGPSQHCIDLRRNGDPGLGRVADQSWVL